MLVVSGVILIVISKHYLVQNDLIQMCIEKVIIERKNTQLTTFFSKSQDSVIIASESKDEAKGLEV